jgi:hypothetical protein
VKASSEYVQIKFNGSSNGSNAVCITKVTHFKWQTTGTPPVADQIQFFQESRQLYF